MNTKALRQKVLDLAIHGKLVPPAYRQAGKSLENIPAEKEGQWFVYVIECVDGSFYKGFTTDLIKRYKQHCAGIGAEWTKTHKPKQLFYWEIHYSEKSAIEREKYLKSGCGREWFKNEVVDKPENWESATVLLEKIRAEKAEKIKKGLPAGRRGELKADKKDSFIFTKECEFDEDKLGKCSSGTRHKRHYEQFADGTVKDIEDEIPFEVPEGWAWCRLPSICRKAITDGTHNSPTTYDKGDFLYITAKNIKADKIDLSNVSYVSREIHEEIYNRCPPELNDVLLTKDGTIGEVAVNNLQEPFSLLSSVALIKPAKNILPWYIAYVLKSNYLQSTMRQSAKGVALKRIILEQINTFLIPLPPFAEQERIVLAIEQFYNKINILEESKSELQTAIKQAKSKILDLAIHGKLVPQDPNDEPAEELLKRIATSDNRPYEKMEEEFDYEIPKNWRFCKVKDVCSVIMGQSPEGEAVSDDKNGMEFHQGKICFGKKYLEESSSFTKHITKIAPKDSVLLCVRAPVGIVNITEREICIGRGLCAVIPKYTINSDFWFYWLQSLQSNFEQKATGTTFRAISVDVIKNQIVAIPPHEEQNRIVNKINELYEQLDKIVLNLV